MKTFEQCCREVAEKNVKSKTEKDLINFISADRTLTEAAHLYAQEQLKGLREVVKHREHTWSLAMGRCDDKFDSQRMTGRMNEAWFIATRIEELIGGSKCRFHGAVNYTNTRGVIMCGHCEKPIDHTPPAHATHEHTKPTTP